jgi:hypothetical protein
VIAGFVRGLSVGDVEVSLADVSDRR